MAAVDSLLRLMTVRSADLLVIASGEVPLLRRAGESSRLSMPALNHELVATFVSELFSDDERARLDGAGSLETTYRLDDGNDFGVKLENMNKGQGVRLTFRTRAQTLRKEGTPERPDQKTLRKEGTPERPDQKTLPKEGTPERPDGRAVARPDAAASAPGPRTAGQRGEARDGVASSAATTPAAAATAGAATREMAVPALVAGNPPDLAPGLASTTADRASDDDSLAGGFLAVEPGHDGAPGRPAIPAVFEPLFERVAYERASDLILSTGRSPRMRVAGKLVELGAGGPDGHDSGDAIRDSELWDLVRAVAGERGVMALSRTGSVDLALEPSPGQRFRANVFRQAHGLAAALRPIRRDVPSLAQLGLPDHLYDLVGYPHGLVLVCGPTGSGKSTTLVALIEHLNRNQARHIVTIEDPIEYQYESQRALIHQRELGSHVTSFSAGLRAALREDPDVILVGEMRDRETIAAALTAAETGHLVLSTLHSSNAVVAIDRIIDVFPEHQQRQVRLQLSIVLRAVLTQFLLATTRPPQRVPAFEKMIVTSAIANQIREDKTYQIPSQIVTGRDAGMIPLERTLADLVRQRLITMDSAREVAGDPAVLAQMAGRV